jgi:hypothetical protein
MDRGYRSGVAEEEAKVADRDEIVRVALDYFEGSVAAGALLGEDSAESVGVAMTLPILFGALFFGHGFGAWFGRCATRRAVRSRIRRLDEEHRPPGQGLTAYLVEQRDRRRRKATRRARAAGIRREAAPSTTVYLLWFAAVLFIALGAYLSDAATRAAHHAANGTTPFVGADLPANVLLNLHVRRVKVEAIAPAVPPAPGRATALPRHQRRSPCPLQPDSSPGADHPKRGGGITVRPSAC